MDTITLDHRLISKFEQLLSDEKSRLLAQSQGEMRDELTISKDDLPDENDLAAVEINQKVAFELRDRERRLLGKINLALARIKEGSFGICDDCEEPIPLKRLEARPFSSLCLACKEQQERKDQIYA